MWPKRPSDRNHHRKDLHEPREGTSFESWWLFPAYFIHQHWWARLYLDKRWMKLAEHPDFAYIKSHHGETLRGTLFLLIFSMNVQVLCVAFWGKSSTIPSMICECFPPEKNILKNTRNAIMFIVMKLWVSGKNWRSTELGLSIILHHGLFQLAAFRESSCLLFFSYLKTGLAVAKWSFKWGSPSLKHGM